MDEQIALDQNSRFGLAGVTNDSNQYILNARINPITNRLIVEGHVTSSNTSIGDTIPGATEGSVLFIGFGGTLAQDNANLFYDDADNFLGLGTNTPSATFDLVGTFQYTDGNQSNGFVLTSDGSGNATWQSLPSFSGYNLIQNNGVSVTQKTTINLSTLLTASDSGGKTALTINTANLASDSTFITDLSGNSTFVTNIANNSTFVTALVANTTFTTDLANDTNFINTLVANNTFVNDLVTEIITTGGGLVQSVTGLNTDNTDPANPVVQISVDGVTITGDGTPGNPLVSAGIATPVVVSDGGTGETSLTAYAPLFGGTTSTSSVQSGTVGTTGQVLTSNGAGALATFQTPTNPGIAYTVNADETETTNYTSHVAMPAFILGGTNNTTDAGWQAPGSTNNSGFGIFGNRGSWGAQIDSLIFTNPIRAYTTILAPSASNNNTLSLDTPNVFRLKFYGNSVTSVSGSFSAIGFSDQSTGGSFWSPTITTENDIKFVFDTNRATMYAVCSNGAAVTSINLSIDPRPFHLYEIVVTPYTNAKFYVDGTLVATITTNLYAASSQLLNLCVGAFTGGSSGGGAQGGNFFFTIPTFALTL